MPRYKLLIEYDGTPFSGWQIQEHALSVQGALTAAIASLTGERVTLQGAGRTATGVHALGAARDETKGQVRLLLEWETKF